MNEEQPKPEPAVEEQDIEAPESKENLSGLKVNYKSPIVGKTCPNCDAGMAENAVLCMSCGYNTKTGLVTEMAKPEAHKEKPRRKRYHGPVSLVINTLILLLLAAAAYSYVYYEGLMIKYRSKLPTGLAEKLPARAKRPVNPQWLQDITYHHLFKNCRAAVEAATAKEYPFFEEYAEATIETATGKRGTGKYLGTKDGFVLVGTASGTTARIPLKDLTLESRLRSDPEGRETYIDKMTQKRVDKVMAPADEETETEGEVNAEQDTASAVQKVQFQDQKKEAKPDPMMELGKKKSGSKVGGETGLGLGKRKSEKKSKRKKKK